MHPEIHERIRRRLPGFCAIQGNAAIPSAIVKSGGDRDTGHYTGLVFQDFGRRGPEVVVKASRIPTQDERILDEYENLRFFHTEGSEFLRVSTPEPLGLEWIGDRPALLLRAHPTAMRLKDRKPRSYLSPRKAPETLLRATRWLIHFAKETQPSWVTLDSAAIDRWFVAPIRRYLDALEPLGRERGFLDEYIQTAGGLRGLQIPLTASHGDFCPANILVSGRDWTVIDWEKPRTARLPLGDLFFFLASLDYVRASGEARGNRGRNFSVAFLSESRYRNIIEQCIREACSSLEIPHHALDWLFLLAWVEAALEKVQYLESQGHEPFVDGAGDWDDVLPVVRFNSGTCENVRDSLERSHRLPWRSWGGRHAH